MEHHLFLAEVLMRTAVRFSQNSPGKFVVLQRTTVQFSFFMEQHSVV